MIQQIPVHKRLKQNAVKFDNLLRELDGMKFMDLKTKELYEITGYQNSLRNDIKLELFNSQSDFGAEVFLYVTLEDSSVGTAIAAIYAQDLVPIMAAPVQEEAEDDEYEEECDCPICAAEIRHQEEPADILRDLMEMLNRMERGQ